MFLQFLLHNKGTPISWRGMFSDSRKKRSLHFSDARATNYFRHPCSAYCARNKEIYSPIKKGHVRGGSSLQALKKTRFFRVREFQNCWENSWTACSEDACSFFFAPCDSTREDAQDEPKRYNSRSPEKKPFFFSEPMNFDPRLKKGFFLGATLHPNLKVILWFPFYDYY